MRASASFVCIACLYQPRKWLTTHNIRTAPLTDIELGVIIGKVEILRFYIFSNNLIHFFKLLQNKIYWLTSAEKVVMWGIWSIEAIVPTLPLYLYLLVLLTKASRSLYSTAGNQVHLTRLYFCDFSNGSQRWWPESLIQQFTIIN